MAAAAFCAAHGLHQARMREASLLRLQLVRVLRSCGDLLLGPLLSPRQGHTASTPSTAPSPPTTTSPSASGSIPRRLQGQGMDQETADNAEGIPGGVPRVMPGGVPGGVEGGVGEGGGWGEVLRESLEAGEELWRKGSTKLSAQEEALLLRGLCAGWVDRLARKLAPGEHLETAVPESEGREGQNGGLLKSKKARKGGGRYEALSLPHEVFLSPSSSARKAAPPMLVYTEITAQPERPDKPYLTGMPMAFPYHGPCLSVPTLLVCTEITAQLERPAKPYLTGMPLAFALTLKLTFTFTGTWALALTVAFTVMPPAQTCSCSWRLGTSWLVYTDIRA